MLELRPLQNILLATDFSEIAAYALEHAGALAVRDDATLHVLHVHVLLGGEGSVSEKDPFKTAQVDTALTKLSQRFVDASKGGYATSLRHSPHGIAVVQNTVRDVSAASAIVDFVQEHAIDLIVMGSHARRGMARMLMGSVAEGVIRRAPVSVLVVGDQQPAPPMGYDNVVVAIDFSPHAKTALMMAKQRLLAPGGRMILLHVIEDPPHPAYFLSREESIMAAFPNVTEKVRSTLRAWANDVALEESRVDFVITEGRAHQQVTNIAREMGAGMIAMGSTGHGHLHWPLLGGVTDKVIRTAPCPVYVAKDQRIDHETTQEQ